MQAKEVVLPELLSFGNAWPMQGQQNKEQTHVTKQKNRKK